MSKNLVVPKRDNSNASPFQELSSASCLSLYKMEDNSSLWDLHMFML